MITPLLDSHDETHRAPARAAAITGSADALNTSSEGQAVAT
jgi:hypothetical protein